MPANMTGNSTEDATSQSCFITGACVCLPGFVRDLEGACILSEHCDLVETTTTMIEISTAAPVFNATTDVPFIGTTDSVVTDIIATEGYTVVENTEGYTFGPTEDVVTELTDVTTGIFTDSALVTLDPFTESFTDGFTESATESFTDVFTESATEVFTDSFTESPTEAFTDGFTESATEGFTDGFTESATETFTDGFTESPTEETFTDVTVPDVTEPVTVAEEFTTDSFTEQPFTEPGFTEGFTEGATQGFTEVTDVTEDVTDSDIQTTAPRYGYILRRLSVSSYQQNTFVSFGKTLITRSHLNFNSPTFLNLVLPNYLTRPLGM